MTTPIPSPADTPAWTALATSLLSQLEAAGALDKAPASMGDSVLLAYLSPADASLKKTISNGLPGEDVQLTPAQMAKLIDHTLLKLDATEEQVKTLCEEARTEKFATVCVRLGFVEQAVELLKGSDVGVACVVGFHEGTHSTEDKVNEAKAAIAAGATELDIVLNWPLLQTQPPSYAAILSELRALRAAAPSPAVLKLIFETSQLSPQQIVAATALAAAAGLDCVKTSTGFCGRGASVQDVRLMKGALEELQRRGWEGAGKMFVKASGGVRSVGELKRVVAVGAGRIGTSSGVKIVREARGEGVDGQAASGY